MLKKLIQSTVIVASLLGVFWYAPLAFAADCDTIDPKTSIECGVDSAAGTTEPVDAESTITNTISDAISLLSFVVGVLAVIMLIVGGLRYATSAGNAETAKTARNTILYALIGLVVAALAQLLVHFVLDKTNEATTPDKKTSLHIQVESNLLTKA